MTASLLAKAKDLTGWPDQDLADIVGIKRATAQAYVSGARVEYLDGQQIKALLDAVRLFRDQVVAGVDEMEMLT